MICLRTPSKRNRPLARLALLLTLFFVFCIATSAHATTTRPVEVACPVCAHEFTAYEVGSTNTFGGTDFDFCAHARGEPPNSHWVWACPSCHYANWADDFPDEIEDADTRRTLRDALKIGMEITLDADQRRIPARDKYALFLQSMDVVGASPGELAHVALLGAWAERLEAPYIGDRIEGVDELRPVWKSLDSELTERMEALGGDSKSGLNWPRRKIVVATAILAESPPEDAPRSAIDTRHLRAAWLLRLRGENATAAPVLRRLADDEDAHDIIRAAASDVLAGIGHETRLQEEWLTYALTAHRSGEWSGDDAASRAHQIGDTYRRLGRMEAALSWYERTLRDPHVAAPVFDVTRECVERWCRGRISDEELEELRATRLDGLLDLLADPETTYDAYRSLRALGERSTIPGIVAALDHEHDKVRACAARTLRSLPELPDNAIDALAKVLSEDLDDSEEYAAAALVQNGSPRAREAFLGGIDSSTERTRRWCVEGLGMTGEANDIPVLLGLIETYPGMESRVCEALTQLVCQPVEKLKTFRVWWKLHEHETRADWTTAVFANGALVLDGVDARTQQMRLIETLASDDVPLRCAALRRLREMTGRSIGWDPLTNNGTYPRLVQERRMAVSAWRTWWDGE